MTDGPKSPSRMSRGQRPVIANADVPSETVGLPGVGEEASAAHFARDMVEGQAGDEEETSAERHVPPLPRDGTG